MATITTSAMINLDVAEAGTVSEAAAANGGSVAAKYSESVHDDTTQDLIQTYSADWQMSSPCDRLMDRDIDEPSQSNIIAAVGTCSEYNPVKDDVQILGTSALSSCPLANSMEEELSAKASTIRYCNDPGDGINRLLLATDLAHAPSTASHAADTSAPISHYNSNASNKRKHDYQDASRREYPATIWPHHDVPPNLQCYKSTKHKELEHSRHSIVDNNSTVANDNSYVGHHKHHKSMQTSTERIAWQQIKRRALDPLPLINNNVIFSSISAAAGANACNQQWQAPSSAHRPVKVLKGAASDSSAAVALRSQKSISSGLQMKSSDQLLTEEYFSAKSSTSTAGATRDLFTNDQNLSHDRPAPAIADQRDQKYPAASCDKGHQMSSTFDGYPEDNDPDAATVTLVEPDIEKAAATEYSALDALIRFDSNCVVMETAKKKARARRGEATDLHSISERKRRVRITERMRALHKLVPHGTKTNKAAMLDEIIHFVTDLQTNLQAKCSALRNMQQSASGSCWISTWKMNTMAQLKGTGGNTDNNINEPMQQQLCSTSCWRTRGHDCSATSSSAARQYIQCSCNGSPSSESTEIHNHVATMQQKQYMMLIDRVLDPMEDALADAERHVTRLLQQRQQHISYTTTTTTTSATTISSSSSRISRGATAGESDHDDDDDGGDEDQDGTANTELAHYLAHTAGLHVMPISQVMDTSSTSSSIMLQQAQQPTHHYQIPPLPADAAASVTDRELYVTDCQNADHYP